MDATSFYRGYGPLGHLRRQMPDIFFRTVDKFSWSSLSFGDAVFIQRPFTAPHLQAAEMVRANRLPLWIDYDDDLLSVPNFNPTHSMYADPAVKKNVATLLQMADIVTVSSEHLKKKYDPLREAAAQSNLGYRQPCIVIPNALNEELLPRPEILEQRYCLASWRGSSTHDKDLAYFTSALQASIKKAGPKWIFNFVGKPFWATMDAMPPKVVVQTPAMEIVEYFQFLAETQPAFVFVPLVDCEFNRAKSNIAWMEAAWAGAACLAPAWDEWNRPGVVRYNSPANFAALMDQLVTGKIDCRKKAAESWQYISENLLLKHTNKLRYGVIDWLMKESESRRIMR